MVLILGLSVAKQQWIRDTVHKFTDHSGLAILTDAPKKRKKVWETWPDHKYISINYDLLRQDLDREMIMSIPWKAVIMDEPHQLLMDWDGKTHAAVHDLIIGKNIPWVFLLTGTPVQAEPGDMGALHHLVDPKLMGEERSKFDKEYVRWEWDGFRPKIVTYRNLNRMRAMTEPHFLRRTDEDVDVERPTGFPVNLDVVMTPLQKKLDDMVKERRSDLAESLREVQDKTGNDENKMITWHGQKQRAGDLIANLDGAMQGTMAARVALAIDPRFLLDSESEWTKKHLVPLVEQAMQSKSFKAPKLDLLIEEIEKRVNGEGEKVVVFLTSLKGARRVYRDLARVLGKDRMAHFVGGMSDQVRETQKDRFMNDPNCMVIVCNDAARAAVNLQAGKYMYHLDLPWNPNTFLQRNGRIQRVGSKHKNIFIFPLVAVGSIDEDVLQAWERKQSVQTVLVGVTSEQHQAMQLTMSL